jgi:hypothetical protein
MDTKCAPGIDFKEGSCIKQEILKNIADNYNNLHSKDTIDLELGKEDMVKEIYNKFNKNYECKDQLCWINQKFVKRMKNNELDKFTFRPVGPKKKLDWLSTTNINDVIEQYERKYKNFVFLGAVPYDFQELRELSVGEMDFDELVNGKMNEDFNKDEKTKEFGMVINLDPHDKPGSHWVSLYANFDKNQIYFFDSFAKKPREKIKKFINKITKYMYDKKYNKKLSINSVLKNLKDNVKTEDIHNLDDFDIRYNKIQHQFKNTECGVYSINFIIRLVGGETFDEITDNILKDDFMNNCRTTYFRN